jgi:hypothetical protein
MSLKNNYFKKVNIQSEQAKKVDHFTSDEYNKFIKNLLFDDDPTYKKDDYIKGLPSDFISLNSIELRISKMKYDKYYFSPNFHRISSERICDQNEVSLWITLSNLVINQKCINFPLVYYSSQIRNSYNHKIYFERSDHKNILTSISNKEILFQVAMSFYYMYKNNVYCPTPSFDMITINKTKVNFKINSIGFSFDLNRIIVLSPSCLLSFSNLSEKSYLDMFLSMANKKYNSTLNKPFSSFVEFFLFEFYSSLVQQSIQSLKSKSNEISSPALISSFHKVGCFVQYKYYDKICIGVLIERLENGIGENFDNCIIASFNDAIDIVPINENQVYLYNGPVANFFGLTIGE